MSMELLKLTSASLPSSNKPVPKICKPAASTLPTRHFDDSIFSPLPSDSAPEEASAHCQVDTTQEPVIQQLATNNPSFSPITVKASDNLALFGTPSSPSSNHEDVSTEDQRSVHSILSSTPNSIRVKVLSSELKEIPSPCGQVNEGNSDPLDMLTPPRALGIPISKKSCQSKV